MALKDMTARIRRLLYILFVFVFLFVFSHLSKDNSQAQEEYAPDEVVVKYRPWVTKNDRYSLRQEIRGELTSFIPQLNVEVSRVYNGGVKETLQKLNRDHRVEYAEPNYKATALGITNDPFLSQQWGLFKIQAAADGNESAWDLENGSKEVLVAVLDTGISKNHPDLSTQIAQDVNFTYSQSSDDVYGHGTHVAGIVAAIANNGLGVAGVGYGSRLVNVKVLDDNGSGYYSWIAQGVVFAADKNIPIINMSLGGSSYSSLLQDAVRYAWSKGSLIVAAAGNSGKSTATYPAFYSEVMAVAATDESDKRANFSNWGSWVEVAAPGVSIYSTLPTSPHKIGSLLSYGYANGTSMASPFVSGLAALLVDNDKKTNSQLRSLINDTADRIAGTGLFWQSGRINAYRALRAIGLRPLEENQTFSTPTPTFYPTPTFTPTPSPTATLTPTVTPSPTLTPSPTPIQSEIPWWCIRYPFLRSCRIYQ